MFSTRKIAGFFQLAQLKTNFRTEILAGITTFMTMSYILVANPSILSNAIFLTAPGDLFGELVIATALAAAVATLVMGLYAKYPFALAPGMGLNAYFAFSVVLGLGIDWQVALAAILIEGLIFIGLNLTKIRSQIIGAIPPCIKHATSAGIGLFIAYIALQNAGIITASEATVTTLADLKQPETIISIVGILITFALASRGIMGALLWGIIITASAGWLLNIAPAPESIIAVPQPPVDLFGQAFIGFSGVWQTNIWEIFSVTFVFLFVDLFDTVGTLTGLGMKAEYIDQNGRFPRVNRALMADAVGTTFGAILGTSTVTSYIESASGISVGGRSGLTAVVTACCFLLSIFLIPLISAIPEFATTPALLMVGILMISSVRQIQWEDYGEAIPAFLTIVMIPLGFSIAEGLAFGLITFPLIKAFQGKIHETNPLLWILALIFLLKFVFT
jgi:AGZA family xanthine/uracil permease-like MFS transporter